MGRMTWLAALLVFLFATAPYADTVSTPNSFTNGTTADADEVNANFTAHLSAINEMYGLHQYADPNEPGTTTGGIQEAVNRCGSGVSGSDPSNGCTVRLACGDVPISAQVTVGGNSTATAKSGVRIIGCGGGSVNADAATNPSVGGTTVVSSVSDYGFKFQACSSCALENFGFNGTNTSTGLLDIAESAASWPSSHVGVIDVDVERVTGYGVRTNANSQVDQLTVVRSSFRDVGGCIQQQYSQNVLTMFLQSECGRLKTGGSKIGFDIVAGSFQFINSFWGTSSTVTGQTGFRLGTAASVFSARDSHFELITNGNTLIDDNTGDSSGHSYGSNTFDGNQVTVVGTSNVCFDVATRGSWAVTNSHIQQTNACTSTFNMSNATDISNGRRLQFTTFNVVDNLSGNNSNWAPTLGTGVVNNLHANTSATATALAANGANCSAGNFPLGVDASGAAEGCTDVVLPAEVSAYTTGTSTPVDGSTACNTGDMHLETDAFKIYFCVDGSTDEWYGVALSDTP